MKTLLLASALGLFVTSAAFADTTVTATTDLNLRAGPGSQFPVVGVIGAGQTTVVKGCINQGKWCNVVTGSEDAWAYSDYLMMDSGGTQVILTQRAPSALSMPGFGWRLSDDEIAELATFLRSSWGNAAAPVSTAQVRRLRERFEAHGAHR